MTAFSGSAANHVVRIKLFWNLGKRMAFFNRLSKCLRQCLRKVLEKEDDMMVIAEATNGEEAVELTRQHVPDVVLMDVDMPKINGIEATRRILSENSAVLIIGVSLHVSENITQAMLRAGACRYLNKFEITQSLVVTIRQETEMERKCRRKKP